LENPKSRFEVGQSTRRPWPFGGGLVVLKSRKGKKGGDKKTGRKILKGRKRTYSFGRRHQSINQSVKNST